MQTSNFKVFLSIFLSIILLFGGNYLINNWNEIKINFFSSKEKISSYLSSFSFKKKSIINQNKTINEGQNFKNDFILPTAVNIRESNFFSPSPIKNKYSEENYLSPTTVFNNNFITKIVYPTSTQKPTKKPKPTKAPDIFPINPELARPGKNSDEVFKIASEKTCVPKEVLKAIAYIESGGFFDVVPEKYFLLYNSYNWWNSEFLTEEKRICGGYGYDQNTGIVPNDSKFAGYKCKEGYGSGLNVMGVMSVSSYEQEKYAKKVASLLGVKQADRRVILDALIIVGLIIKENVKNQSCSGWSGHDIVKAACGYYGSCGIADGTYYCATFCRNYKKFGGKGDCNASAFGDYCWK